MIKALLPHDLKQIACTRTLDSAARLDALRGCGNCTVYTSALASAEAPATPNLAEAP